MQSLLGLRVSIPHNWDAEGTVDSVTGEAPREGMRMGSDSAQKDLPCSLIPDHLLSQLAFHGRLPRVS